MKSENVNHDVKEYCGCELEKALLSALLIRPAGLPEVTGVLREEMFYSPDAGFIWSAICSLYNEGRQPDFLTVEAGMRRMDEERTVRMGGIGWLSPVMGQVRHGGNLRDYAAEIKRLYLLRLLEGSLLKIVEEARGYGGDPVELTGRAEEVLMNFRERGVGSTGARLIGAFLEEAVDVHCANRQKGENATRVMSGLREFDALYGGMHNGELLVLGGRPGDGKSAFSLHLAIAAAQQGKQAVFFSLEMSNMPLMNRVFTGHAGIATGNLRASSLSDSEMEKMRAFTARWKELPLYLEYMPSGGVEDIRARVLLLKKRRKCDFVVVDHLHAMQMYARKGELPVHTVGRIAKAFKALALEADCPVLLLSQLNRECEKRSERDFLPQQTDLRDSGEIEQVADGVFFIFRPERHGMEADPKTGERLANICFLIARKHRNGSSGIARVRHNGTLTLFMNRDEGIKF